MGNVYFKILEDRVFNVIIEGIFGEEKVVELELKIIVDIGLVSIVLYYWNLINV